MSATAPCNVRPKPIPGRILTSEPIALRVGTPDLWALASSRSSSPEPCPSPTDRCRRAPPPSHLPPMQVVTLPYKHTLDVDLPSEIRPEMVTISAKKGDRLDIVADAWHKENDCHYEWQIRFPPHDIDMSSVHAKVTEGHLTIDVQRRRSTR